MDFEEARHLVHRIAAVDFGQPGGGVPAPHRSPRVRNRQRLEESRVGV
jgi:hypothetical protein